jgi:hypothetical protein
MLSKNRAADLLALVLAIAHTVLAFTAAETKSPTFDEPTHFAAGYSYWLRHDFRLDAESGILSQRWAAIPLLIARPQFPAVHSAAWRDAAQGEVGSEFLYDIGNDARALLAKGRAMMALFGAATCLLVYGWAKQLFGPVGGLIAATFAAFCATLLANAPLVTSDVPLAFWLSAAAWSVWRTLLRPQLSTVIVASVALAAAMLAKISGAIVVVVIVAMLVAFAVIERRRRMMLRAITALTVVAAIALTITWTAYDFRFSATQSGVSPFAEGWQRLDTIGGTATTLVNFARQHRLLPEAYLFGVGYVYANAQLRPAFLDGDWSVIGFPDFFLRSFFYKTPLPFVLVLAMAALAAVLATRGKFADLAVTPERRRSLLVASVPVWSLLLVYGAFVFTARLNIGHRHLLPLYPPLFVMCGATAVYFRAQRFRLAAIAIVLLAASQLVEAIATWPNYLAYFNELAGGPARGYTHLVDSSLDWGQDLPALRRGIDDWQRIHGNQAPVYLAYFGKARPAYYGIDALALPATFEEEVALRKLTGGLYCISATALQQVYSRAMGPWCVPYEQHYQRLRPEALEYLKEPRDPALLDSPEIRAALSFFNHLQFARLCATLRHRTPSGDAGHSILLFDLSEDDVKLALEGRPGELAPRMDVAGRQ